LLATSVINLGVLTSSYALPWQESCRYLAFSCAASKEDPLAATLLSTRACQSVHQSAITSLWFFFYSRKIRPLVPDAFRRTIVPNPRYKAIPERAVVLVRSCTAHTNTVSDLQFKPPPRRDTPKQLLCGLMNLSHSVVDLHEYAAMQLLPLRCLAWRNIGNDIWKTKLGGRAAGNESQSLDMYGEISHALLPRLIKHALTQRQSERRSASLVRVGVSLTILNVLQWNVV
jgi:hypothetical protein